MLIVVVCFQLLLHPIQITSQVAVVAEVIMEQAVAVEMAVAVVAEVVERLAHQGQLILVEAEAEVAELLTVVMAVLE